MKWDIFIQNHNNAVMHTEYSTVVSGFGRVRWFKALKIWTSGRLAFLSPAHKQARKNLVSF